MISLVRRTSRVVYEPADALERLRGDHPLIVATWHGQFMMTAGFRPGPDIKVAAMARIAAAGFEPDASAAEASGRAVSDR